MTCRRWWPVAALATVAGCGLAAPPGGGGLPAQRVPVPAGDKVGVAWLRGDLIAYGGSRTLSDPERIHLTSPSGGVRTLRLPTPHGCAGTNEQRPWRLPDGRLGLVQECDRPDARPVATYRVLAADPDSGRTTTLAELGGRIHPTVVSLRPGARDGYVSEQRGRECAGVARLSDGRVRPWTGLRLDSSAVRPDTVLFRPPTYTCDGDLRADLATVTPDGRRVVLVASLASIGHDGAGRGDDPWNVYVVDTATGSARPVLTDVHGPLALAVAADGRIAVSGQWHGTDGAWLVKPGADAPRLVDRGQVDGLAFSPDGGRLAATVLRDGDTANSDLMIYRLG